MGERAIARMRIRTLRRTLLISLVLVTAPVVGQEKATDLEIAQLPKFCWEQMGSKVAKGPAFRIPKGCGPGMNHYCPGLVQLVRAKHQLKKSASLSLLGRAEGAAKYTLEWMQGYPNCAIRSHVEATLAEIRSLQLKAKSQK